MKGTLTRMFLSGERLYLDTLTFLNYGIAKFYPKPGRLVSNDQTFYVVPDIYVEEKNGEFIIKMNDYIIVLTASSYNHASTSASTSSGSKAFLSSITPF